MKENDQYTGLEIAVIGMSGRFPGSGNIYEFWDNLKKGLEAISFFSPQELVEAGIKTANLTNPNFVPTNGGILETRDYFDSSFFDYSPVEADALEPQVRIFLECAWEALEDAGYVPGIYKGAIGVYAGASTSFYWEAASVLTQKSEELGILQNTLLSSKESLSTQVAYKMNLTGPAVMVQSACSTSLLAIDHACRSLWTGACDMALAGGISITPDAKTGYLYREGLLNSPDGHCRAFDADAGGLIGGEGIGIVVLKALERAIADQDHIYAIIKGIAVNNDGKRKIGYTAPSITGQVEVIQAAQQMAEIPSGSVTYVETHGTATSLGDPIEISALTRAFNTNQKGFCAIGSVKTNIGHLDAGAGAASFIKTVLALKHKQIPPTLHFNSPNPKIDFIDSPFYVNTALTPWDNHNSPSPRRAGVSSLGIGGTNVHVILEEWTLTPTPAADNRHKNPRMGEQVGSYRLLPLSAKTPTALQTAKLNLEKYLADNPGIDPADVAFTLQSGRKSFPYRNLGVRTPAENSIQWLSARELNQVSESQATGKDIPPIILVLPGPGTFHRCRTLVRQWYENLPCFREEMDHCLKEWESVSGEDIKSSVSPGEEWDKENPEETGSTPVIFDFIFQYAMAKLLVKLGVTPFALVGYSSGEYAAACLSGIFSLRQALLWLRQGAEKNSSPPRLNFPEIPLISMVTGNRLTPEVAMDPGYWGLRNNLIEEKPVSWPGGELQRLWEEKSAVLVEIDSPEHQKTFPPGNTASEKTSPSGNTTTGKPIQKNGINFSLKQPELAVMQHIEPFQAVIGQLWLYGVTIDWGCCGKGNQKSRVPLPTYPFEPYLYPIDRNIFRIYSGITRQDAKVNVQKKTDIADWFYIPTWKRSSLTTGDNTPRPVFNWLIFLDEQGIGTGLVEILKARSQEVITVAAGDRFGAVDEKTYILDPRQETHYQRLLDELSPKGMMPTRVVHMWSIHRQDETDCGPLTMESFNREQYRGFYSILFLARALVRKSFRDDMHIIALSTYTVDVSGQDLLKPGKATIHAATKVITQEFPFIRCRCIDMVLPPPGTPQEKQLLEKLSLELTCETFEPTAAYRGERRWLQDYESLPLGEALNPVPILRKKGIYLVIGGLGKIGNRLAAYLAGEYQARLVLVSRSPLPGKDRWNDWLSNHSPQDPTSRKILSISQLEKMGGEVLVLPADVGSPGQMHRVIDRAEEHFGPLNGVFHAAGETGDDGNRPIDQVNEKHFQNQFRARVYGLIALDQALQGRKPDFCLVVSSLVSVLAGLGFSAYAAACIFIDSYIQVRSKTGDFPWISVNTAEWDFDPQEKRVSSIAAEMQQLSMTPEEGMETFKRILSRTREHQVIISTADLRTRVNKWIKLESLREVSSAAPAGLRRSHSPVLHPRPALSRPYEAPTSPVQEALVETWQNLFGFGPLGIHDDFFELGGDSLKAITALTLIHKKLDVVVPLADFFNNPTAGTLGLFISRMQKSKYIPLEPVEKKEYYVASSAQKRLYLLDTLHPHILSYHITTPIRLVGHIEIEKIKGVFQRLIQRHESLRTAFTVIGGEPVQRIYDYHEVVFEIEGNEQDTLLKGREGDLSLPPASVYAEYLGGFVRSFDLSRAPLLRVGIIKLAPGEHIFILDIHHIITDAYSITSFVREFMAFYHDEEPGPLALQYKDYSCWQARLKQAGRVQEQEAYWLDIFPEVPPVLDLPYDYERPKIMSFEGKTVTFEIESGDTHGLKKIALEENASLFMVILAAYTVFLSKLSGQYDITIGTSSLGRNYPGLESIIGFFINTLPLRNYPDSSKTFRQFLQEARIRTLQALDNQDYQFEDLCERVIRKMDPGRNPLFDLMFTLQNVEIAKIEVPELTLTSFQHDTLTSIFDINLNGFDRGGKISFAMEYCTKLFKEKTMEVFINHFKTVISQVVQNPDQKISQITLTPVGKKKQILSELSRNLESE